MRNMKRPLLLTVVSARICRINVEQAVIAPLNAKSGKALRFKAKYCSNLHRSASTDKKLKCCGAALCAQTINVITIQAYWIYFLFICNLE